MSHLSLKNVARFAANLFYCTRVMGNPVVAYGFLRRGHQPEAGSFRLGKVRFQARKGDWIAVREVLINDEYACITRLLGPEATPRVLDLGANIGSFALRMFLHCPGAQVASVEAAKDTFDVLRANKELNPAFDWQVFHNGIWRSDGPLGLVRRDISVSHLVTEGEGDDAVEGIALDTLLKRLGWDRVDLIKMDIEGGEEAVVPAAIEVLRRTRFLIIEVHNDRIDSCNVTANLKALYRNWWQINDRTASKPLYLLSNERLELAGLSPVAAD